ncbi:MAG: chromophore lyase CpcT/CpeT [Allosphingosinicella sp.]|uniref:chromophore lyase CpcT/CpeT n=1 Tax=Allosphingosinicella sp. TaxID=2823234 RepID=UPI00395D1AB9
MIPLLAAALLTSAAAPDPLLDDYARVAVGAFSSAAQARDDRRYDEVEARVVRLWPDRTDGLWLYQEQAIVGGSGAPPRASRDRPYFQRIGHVYRLPDGRLRRDNYVLAEPARFVGYGRRGDVAAPTPADLGPAGCHNVIERVAAGHFIARTEDCANSHRGAAYMIGLAIKTADVSVNWDRGFTADGSRVWGPEEGGYIFRRIGD